MKFTILATGKCRNKAILELEAEYLKRLTPHHPTQVVEMPQATGPVPQIKQQEAQNQLAKIPTTAFVIALDEKGKTLSTRQFAKVLKEQANKATKQIIFIIGGAEGLDPLIHQRANLVLSLSAFTFPHMMVRPILAEQIYRATTLNIGHPYHRD